MSKRASKFIISTIDVKQCRGFYIGTCVLPSRCWYLHPLWILHQQGSEKHYIWRQWGNPHIRYNYAHFPLHWSHILVSKTYGGVQQHPTALDYFCGQQELASNLEKTKTMIRGRQIRIIFLIVSVMGGVQIKTSNEPSQFHCVSYYWLDDSEIPIQEIAM